MNTQSNSIRHAFFDLDKTLTQDFTLHQFCQLLKKHKVIDNQFEKKEKELTKKRQAGQIPYRQAGELANLNFTASIKGLSPDDLADSLDQFVNLPTLFRSWVEPVFTLLKKHHFQTHLISGSSLPIVSAVAKHLDFDTFIASLPEVINDQYTGQVTSVMDFEHKQAVVEAILSPHPDSALILGFGDSDGDIDMLNHANIAFVIDPTHDQIIQTANHNSWHITSDPKLMTDIITHHL